jgi:chromate transporter
VLVIHVRLLVTFAKVGFFTIGGGYAMIPLIQRELATHGWLSPAGFVDILGISEMTPGPIAVNSATFVGYNVSGGIAGAALATLGVALPSLTLMLAVSATFFRYRSHPGKIVTFHLVRPVVTGLLAVAAVTVATQAFLRGDMGWDQGLRALNPWAVAIFLLALLGLLRYKLNPILVIAGSAVCGLLSMPLMG